MQVHDPRRPSRQDTFDLRGQIHSPHDQDVNMHYHGEAAGGPHGAYISDEEEHSVLEDDSDDEMHGRGDGSGGGEGGEEEGDFIEDDDSSSLSIPNESIDFDLVYSLHSFAATVEGQANVVKGDSLFLMDDSNSYWWLVRVLKTQEVGYIPAENIETPFERLARLNKHRNVDLATPTQADKDENLNDRPRPRKGVNFTPQFSVHRYPPAVWDEEAEEEEDIEWDDGEYSDEDPQLAEDLRGDAAEKQQRANQQAAGGALGMEMEPDDGMQWDRGAVEANQQAQMQMRAQQQQQQQQAQQEEAARRQQQQQQQQQAEIEQRERQQQQQQAAIAQQRAQQQQQQQQQQPLQPSQQQQLRTSSSRERLSATPDRDQQRATSPSSVRQIDPLQATETRKLTVTPTIARDDEEKKRAREEEITADEARKKAKPGPAAGVGAPASVGGATSPGPGAAGKAGPIGTPVSSSTGSLSKTGGGAKLRKERDGANSISSAASVSEDESNGGKKKKGSFIGGLFGRNKTKKGSSAGGSVSLGSVESVEAIMRGPSEDGGRLSSSVNGHGGPDGLMSPTTQTAMAQQQAQFMQQQQQQQRGTSLSMDQSPGQRITQDQGNHPTSLTPGSSSSISSATGAAPGGRNTPEVSSHASQLRQHDQQQQALYLNKYLNRSPASPPNAGVMGPGGEDLSWGLQTAQAVAASRDRGYGGHLQQQQAPAGINTSTSTSSNNMLSIPSPTSIAPSSSNASMTGGGRARPGSLIISPGAPDLSVIRVFAGQNLQTEATFKTVLLNSSTTSADLIRQAIQRFRLPNGAGSEEERGEYYLSAVKQVEGSSAILRPDEKPLCVFESLVEEAKMEMEVPKVKRSSVGSISSVSSNLSMHPAIKKLPMNDFTDDSAVKFYLNRKGGPDDDDMAAERAFARGENEEGEETLIADSSMSTSEFGGLDATSPLSPRNQQGFLSVSTSSSTGSVGAERFSSPSYRFPMQLVIYSEDLPDDMVFDPLTEAIVFKHTLRERDRERGGSGNLASSSGASAGAFRRKVFVFPRNVTVAEVIELGLERFGIQEGVVDGGDEVEDKLAKRRSGGSRVRYGLFVKAGSNADERELVPASRLIESFPRPPTFKRTDSGNSKRRSTDSAMLLLGTIEDVAPEDPIFVLRRARSYRNSTSRHRTSAPLDEIALSKLHRSSAGSTVSGASSRSEATASPPLRDKDEAASPLNRTAFGKIKVLQQDPQQRPQQQQQPSRAEIIAAQRAATRANQQSVLSAQVNSVRGVDVLLAGNAMLRSARHDSVDRMRYSYVEPDGETYDISDIVEEEWRGNNPFSGAGVGADGRRNHDDLLDGLLKGESGRDDKLERVLSKINKGGKAMASQQQQQQRRPDVHRRQSSTDRSASPSSQYSTEDIAERYGVGRSRSVTPSANAPAPQSRSTTTPANSSRATSPYSYKTARTASPTGISEIVSTHSSRPGTTTPTAGGVTTRSINSVLGKSGRNPSVASMMSDISGYATPATHIASPSPPAGTDGGDDLEDSPIQGRTPLVSNFNFSSSSPAPSSPASSPIPPRASPALSSSPASKRELAHAAPSKKSGARKVYIPKDDFGIPHMMAIIEYKAKNLKKQQHKSYRGDSAAIELTRAKLPPLDPVDEMLFGRPMDLEALHPQIRDIYKDTAKYLDDTDKELDHWLHELTLAS